MSLLDTLLGIGRSRRARPVFVALGFVAVGAAVTMFAGNAAAADQAEHRLANLELHADQSLKLIQQRLSSAEEEIRGLKAAEFTRTVAPSDRQSFERIVRADESVVEGGYPGFSITPETTHEDMFVVDYVEPLEGNESAFGYDLGTNSSRRIAIEYARDSAAMAASEGINLVQDKEPRYGFLLLRPIYKSVEIPQTVEQRRSDFVGIVNGVFIVAELAADIGGADTAYVIAITDLGPAGNDNEGVLLFTTVQPDNSTGSGTVETLSVERKVSVGDRVWSIETSDPSPQGFSLGSLTSVVWITGALLSLAFAFAAYTIMRSRERAAEAAHVATVDLIAQSERLREALDQALEGDRLKTAFLANMSHELRTPLNAVIGLSSVLSNEVFGPLSEKQRDYLERISGSGDHLLHLIDDLLDMARIEEGTEELQLEPLNLVAEINNSLDMIRNQADQQGVGIEQPGDQDRTVVVNADRRRLRQVLLNLMANAVKFTNHGGQIGVDLAYGEDYVEIAIWDTGIGIATKDLSKIFEPFHQVDSRLARSREGSGLGLALSRRLVEMHEASIDVESSDEGSRFIIKWPLAEPDSVVDDSRRRREQIQPTAHTGTKVLLAEDNEVNRLLISDLLEVAGCVVIQATDGQMALDVARRELPDIIVLDIQLPLVDGLSVAREIRADGLLSSTPLLAVTAMAMAGDMERIMAAGFDGYLAKPFTQDQFFAAINALILEPAII